MVILSFYANMVGGQNNDPFNIRILIPSICKNVRLHCKGELRLQIKFRLPFSYLYNMEVFQDYLWEQMQLRGSLNVKEEDRRISEM